ncbi:PA14 domain-containing protein [Fimbriiglobus ruber]|uniref:PA14 domain-containing protein n=1 Tax=Fimbriiglobus ruber TaxID=1908690 RepID=A0A225EBZ0_9BACT|nr:PA14 domain-containing protein [Fimbriiglobus ruber]OWK46849.1 hypothetical protein FRUB_00548 [Fimbriiglobus ruber]
MSWPLPQEINEAIQSPSVSFADPDLKAGDPVVGATGLPLPRSGNFADVYQIRGADGRDWAVKCFTRPVVGLDKRYDKIGTALADAKLPFTIGFTFLKDGIRHAGHWYPAVKMEWVEGLQLNQFVRENAGKPHVLNALLQMWTKVAKRLRDAGLAHADLQHGNVLLVAGSKPGSFGLKLIDYDGMYLPALANQPSGELGHAAYQHPQRAETRVYSQDLDRFPHLVVASALKGLAVVGKELWDRYDTGDNLLFTEADLRNPAGSKLIHELWQTGHPEVRALVGRLAVSARRPLTQTPWLDSIAPDGAPTLLTPEEDYDAAVALGLAAPRFAAVVQSMPSTATVAALPTVVAPALAAPVNALDFGDDDDRAAESDEPRKKKSSVPILIAAVIGMLVIGGGAIGALALMFGKTRDVTQVSTPPEGTSQTNVPKVDSPPTKKDPADKNPAKPGDDTKPRTQPAGSGTNPPPQNTVTGPVQNPFQVKVEEQEPNPIQYPGNLRVLNARWVANPTAVGSNRWPDWMGVTSDSLAVLFRYYNERSIGILDTATGSPVGGFSGPEFGNLAAEPVPLAGGKLVTQSIGSDEAVVWDVKTWQVVRRFPSRTFPGAVRLPWLLGMTKDGRYLAVGVRGLLGIKPTPEPGENLPAYARGSVVVVDTRDNREIARTELCGGLFSFTDDDSALMIADDYGRVSKVVLESGSVTSSNADLKNRCPVLAITPKGDRVYYEVPTPDGKLAHIYDAATGQLVSALPSVYRNRGLALTPDGKWLLTFAMLNIGKNPVGLHVAIDDANTLANVAWIKVPGATGAARMRLTPDGTGILLSRQTSSTFAYYTIPGDLVASGTRPKPPTPTPPPGTPAKTAVVEKKSPVPDDEAAAKSDADIKAVFKTEYAKKSAADKKVLAKKLLELADKTPDDMTARYVMLRSAKDLAIDGLDATMAVQSIEKLGTLYEVDANELKVTALEKILAAGSGATLYRAIIDAATSATDAAEEQDSFDLAIRYATMIVTANRKGNLAPTDESEARVAQLKKLRDQYGKVKAAIDSLKDTPNDAEANLLVGRFRCFTLGKWADGAKNLAKSNNAPLKELGEQEVAPPTDAAGMAKLGDTWWEFAHDGSADASEKKMAEARARHWYNTALPELTGLALAKVQGRLDLTVGMNVYKPGLILEFVKLPDNIQKKPRIEPRLLHDATEFSPPPGKAAGTYTVRWTGYVVPPKPGRYRFVVSPSNNSLGFKFQVGKHPLIADRVTARGNKPEIVVTLTDKPTPLAFEHQGFTFNGEQVKILWSSANSKEGTEELVPAECLFHDKKAEILLK